MIYLDNAATTKPCEQAVSAALRCVEFFGNPSSPHGLGLSAERLIEQARADLAQVIKAKPDEIFFTSGGTEANNMLMGVARTSRKLHFITTVSEHPSVAAAFSSLSQEHRVDILDVDNQGAIDLEKLAALIGPETALVSVIHSNNETGALADIYEIGRIIKSKNPNTLFHLDAVASFCKHRIDVNKAKIDLLTASAHKIHGFKGVGLLYVRTGVKLSPRTIGGSQQKAIRPGTENISGILAFAAAAIAMGEAESHHDRLWAIKERFMDLTKTIPDCYLNGPEGRTGSPYIVNLSFVGVPSEVLLNALSAEEIYISAGSACSSKGKKPPSLSYLGIDEKRGRSAVRFSFNRMTTEEEADICIKRLKELIPELRGQIYQGRVY